MMATTEAIEDPNLTDIGDNAARGLVNGCLMSLAFWALLSGLCIGLVLAAGMLK
jgi:hypothetical protein